MNTHFYVKRKYFASEFFYVGGVKEEYQFKREHDLLQSGGKIEQRNMRQASKIYV